MTNDGELANRLTHPRYGVKRPITPCSTGRWTTPACAASRAACSLTTA